MDLKGPMNSSSVEANTWVDYALQRQKEWHADILNIDLLPYFKNDHQSTKTDHEELIRILKKLKNGLKDQSTYNVQVRL